jgi:ribonuclease HII
VALTVGIDEVGYGPKLGPLVVTAACASRPLKTAVRIADSKKVFSQAKGIGTLEPAVLGFLRAPTFAHLVGRLSMTLPDVPWYREPLALPSRRRIGGLQGAFARFVDPAEFNRSTKDRNKSEFLFEVAAGLINRVRETHRGPYRFVVGKHGGRHFYLRGIQELISPTVMVIEETPGRSVYEIPGATIEFLESAEDRHELVALASMIGKYVRECAMKLFNDFWMRELAGLRRTAGYGLDGRRFYRDIESTARRLNIPSESLLRLR